MTTLRGVSGVVSRIEAVPTFDFQCPLLSLPLAFGTRLDVPTARWGAMPPGLKIARIDIDPAEMPRLKVDLGIVADSADGARALTAAVAPRSDTARAEAIARAKADTRAEITRRMLAAADQESDALRRGGGRSSEIPWRIGAAVGIAGLLPAAALAVYAAVGTPAAIDPARGAAAAEEGPHDRAKLAAAAEQLKERLQREPGHVEGWVLLGRTFASLERFADARQAYDQAIALAPNEPRLHAELGELIVLTTGGVVTPEAQAELAKAGDDPRARFYGAEAALQRGDRESAKSALKALLATAPAEAPWRQAVAERLAEIAPDEQPPSGPREGCEVFHDLDASSLRRAMRSAWPSIALPSPLLVQLPQIMSLSGGKAVPSAAAAQIAEISV